MSYTHYEAQRLDGMDEWIKSKEDYGFSDIKAAFTISPKISIKGKYTLAPSIQFRYNYTQRYRFYIEPNFNHIQPALKPGVSDAIEMKTTHFSLSAGILFNTKKLYLGYSMFFKPIAHPILYTLNGFAFKPRSTHYIQTGYRFQRNSESKFSFTPQLVITISTAEKLTFSCFTLSYLNVNFRYKNSYGV